MPEKRGRHRAKTPEEHQIDVEIGQRIAQLRQNASQSQAEFAGPLGVSHAAVSVWEKGGGITHHKLLRICAVHNVSPEWLLTGGHFKGCATANTGADRGLVGRNGVASHQPPGANEAGRKNP